MIQVRRIGDGDPLEFEVVVQDGQGTTTHRVTFARALHQRLGGAHTRRSIVSMRRSASCSTVSRRSRSSGGSMSA